MRAKPVVVLLSLCCILLAAAASAASAAQRVDMKVLLLGASGSEPSFLGWQAELRREGVPFDQLVATPGHAPITAATLSQTAAGGIEEARYQAVIVAVGQLPRCEEGGCVSALAPEEWAALSAYEQTFHVRQLTAYAFPNAELGLNTPTSSGPLDGDEATVTTAGQTVFPYLNGTVKVGAGTWGYGATPLEGAAFTTLLTDASGASLLGVYTHPEGREEMVQTFDNSAVQLHTQLLRHGQLAWVTRGTFFGDQRNYLEMHVDDVFLPDDIWDTTAHATDFTPADAVRMSTGDVATAAAWSRATGLRLDALYNGGGSVQYREEHAGSDPLLTAFQANRATFGWVNHTYDHPNLDCSARGFIVEEIQQNTRWARANGFAVNAAELVTGEHSGLANLIPGVPGTIDPPSIEEAEAAGRGTLPRRQLRIRGHGEHAARRDERVDHDDRRAGEETAERRGAARMGRDLPRDRVQGLPSAAAVRGVGAGGQRRAARKRLQGGRPRSHQVQGPGHGRHAQRPAEREQRRARSLRPEPGLRRGARKRRRQKHRRRC